jgi:hypothetical protein
MGDGGEVAASGRAGAETAETRMRCTCPSRLQFLWGCWPSGVPQWVVLGEIGARVCCLGPRLERWTRCSPAPGTCLCDRETARCNVCLGMRDRAARSHSTAQSQPKRLGGQYGIGQGQIRCKNVAPHSRPCPFSPSRVGRSGLGNLSDLATIPPKEPREWAHDPKPRRAEAEGCELVWPWSEP